MITDHIELFDSILEALNKEYPDLDSFEAAAMERLAGIATLGSIEYVKELEEAVSFLKETIKRLQDDKISLLNDLKRFSS